MNVPRARFAAAVCLIVGGAGLAGCSDMSPPPPGADVFTFGEENWVEASGWVEAQESEIEMVGADFGIATNAGDEPETQIFVEVYQSEYPGESNRDERMRDISTVWKGDVWWIPSLDVDGNEGHGLAYEVIEPDRIVEEYYFDGESSIYRVLIETQQGSGQTANLDMARSILTEHTVLNDQ